MYAQSQPYPETIELMRRLKAQYGLQVAAVSNEGRELTVYRVQQFNLGTFIDFFVSSCFVHYRKPDADIYRIALNISQVSPQQVVYIDNEPMFVEVAQSLEIRGMLHKDHETTQKALEAMGLALRT
jgi:putative hydrolase of the HAD superfamily